MQQINTHNTQTTQQVNNNNNQTKLKVDIPEFGVHHVVELQLHHTEILHAKETAHTVYEFFRAFFRGNNKVVDERLGQLMRFAKSKATSGEELVQETVDAGDVASMIALADLLKSMGQHSLQEPLRRAVLEAKERQLGADHVKGWPCGFWSAS